MRREWAAAAQGTTALQAAASEGWVEVVAVLADDQECQVNSIDIAGRTALHWAAAYGHVAVVNELWCRSANVQQIDHGGWTGASNGFPAPASGVQRMIASTCHASIDW